MYIKEERHGTQSTIMDKSKAGQGGSRFGRFAALAADGVKSEGDTTCEEQRKCHRSQQQNRLSHLYLPFFSGLEKEV